jgi:hypothetical protein
MLTVFTARLSYGGADRLDITRSTAHNQGQVMGLAVPGAPFAPSWKILNRAHREAETAERLAVYGRRQQADHAIAKSWQTYKRDYQSEMRDSYRNHRGAWQALLSRSEVTLVCYCTDASMCHRTLLAEILVKCGARYLGERTGCQVPLL